MEGGRFRGLESQDGLVRKKTEVDILSNMEDGSRPCVFAYLSTEQKLASITPVPGAAGGAVSEACGKQEKRSLSRRSSM